jgi:DtxR family Mn-dependent transcriptional regulator
MRLDRVHGEADRLEHVISEELEEQIASALGQPDLDPHGDPIPTKAGGIIAKPGRALTDMRPGGRVRVVRVSDRSEKVVRELTEAGLLPGVVAEVVAVGPQRVDIRIERRMHRLSAALAAAVYVVDLDAEDRRARGQPLDPGRPLQTRRVPHA